MNVYFDAYSPISFWNFIEKLNQKPLLKSQKLTLCNASRVGHIQHVENKISQHLKKMLLYPENKFEIIFNKNARICQCKEYWFVSITEMNL